MTVSVALISLNEERVIGQTLSSVSNFADEIVLVDSGSTDSTVAIAKSFGAEVYHQEWLGFAMQKNFALQRCTCEWILAIDCDEIISAELADAIKEAIKVTSVNGYTVDLCELYMGKQLSRVWKKFRLVRRSAAPCWSGGEVHEGMSVIGKVAHIPKGRIIHNSYKDFDDHMKRMIKYAKLSAISYHKRGKKTSTLSLLIRPIYAFAYNLTVKKGILDGIPGVMYAFGLAHYTFMKYAFLWELKREQ